MTRFLWTFFLFSEIVLAAVGLLFVLGTIPVLSDLVELGLWNAIALIYLVAGGVLVWSSARRADLGLPDPSEDEHVVDRVLWLLPYITSLVGITAALITSIVKAAEEISSAEKLAYNILAAVAMIFSWAVLQFGLARGYYRAWRHEGGLRFPGTDRPRLADFAYFSFTIGAAFATSDVAVESSRMRARVLMHTVWSFLYNAAIVAMAISLLTGR